MVVILFFSSTLFTSAVKCVDEVNIEDLVVAGILSLDWQRPGVPSPFEWASMFRSKLQGDSETDSNSLETRKTLIDFNNLYKTRQHAFSHYKSHCAGVLFLSITGLSRCPCSFFFFFSNVSAFGALRVNMLTLTMERILIAHLHLNSQFLKINI